MNKKVALCLHGLVGNLEKYGKGAVIPYKLVYDSYIQNLYDKSIEIDIFLHSWSMDLEDEIKLLYNPKSSIFEKQKMFVDEKIIGKKEFAVTSRFYSLMVSNSLKIEYEKNKGFVYDYVLMGRFDVLLNKKIDFRKINNKYFYLPSPTNPHGSSCQCDFCDRHGNHPQMNDLIFLSSSRNMNIFSSLYSNLNEYGRETGHTVVASHMRKTGLIDIAADYFKQIPPKYPNLWTKIGMNANIYCETDTPLVRRSAMGLHLKIVDILIRYLKLDAIYFFTIVRPILFVKNPKRYLKKILRI